jgi:hypothetical protein
MTTGLGPWGQVQPIVVGTQEPLDQQTAQRSEQLPEGLLRFQEGGGRRIAEAEADDPVKLVVELLPECVLGPWTSRRHGTILALAHWGGLRIVPGWDLFRDQDKPLGLRFLSILKKNGAALSRTGAGLQSKGYGNNRRGTTR